MTTVLHPPQAPFANTDAHERASIRSFRADGRSNAPSISGSFTSLKSSKKIFLVTGFFSKAKNRSRLASTAAPEPASEPPLGSTENLGKPHIVQQEHGILSSHSLPPLRPQKTTKQFMRRLTTKFRSTTLPPPPPPSAPATVTHFPAGSVPRTSDVSNYSVEKRSRKRNSLIGGLASLTQSRPAAATNSQFLNKDARMAALRARGLAPQLNLSEQEAQMDARMALVHMSVCPEGDDQVAEAGPSAADRIKEEWAVKAQELEQKEKERMKSFKFGTPPESPTVPLTKFDESLNHATPSPLKLSSRRSSFIGTSPKAPPRSPLPSPPSTPARADTDFTPMMSDSPSSSPTLEAPRSPKQKHIPPPLLLPSNSAEVKDVESTSVLLSSPHPRSPWLDISLPPSPLPPLSPILGSKSIPSPCTSTSTTPKPHYDDSPTYFLRQPPERVDSEAGTVSSLGSPPSLSSSVPTSASSEVLAEQWQAGRGRSRTLGDPTIPRIAELYDGDDDEVTTTSNGLLLRNVSDENTPSSSSITESTTPAPPQRRATAPVQRSIIRSNSPVIIGEAKAIISNGKERKPKRKSIFGTLKRPQILVPPESTFGKSNKTEDRDRRKSAIGNLRLGFNNNSNPKQQPSTTTTMTTTVLSPTSTSRSTKTFNSSHLPPSPRLPSFSGVRGNRTTHGVGLGEELGGAAQVSRRVSVFEKGVGEGGATIHDQATILMEVNKIEDEESQRLTESAFLV